MDKQIEMFFHCAECMPQRPIGTSPKEWARIECGWTPKGFQVWCVRCNKNIVHIDLKGQKVGVVEERGTEQ